MTFRALLLVGVALSSLLVAAVSVSRSSEKAEPKLAHMVFFGLKDRSKEAREKFVASCEKYLSGHDGVDYFSVGVIAEDVVEPGVSMRDFDVALHLVFQSKAMRDKYLKAERHVKFVDENRPQFDKVRVFDSYLMTK